MKSVFLGQRRGRRVRDQEKNERAAPVAKERVELNRWLISGLWALNGGGRQQGADGTVISEETWVNGQLQ